MNIHASLLPRWRGAAPIQRAILAGDRETGITIMQMDAGLDTGAMLLKKSLPIREQDTAATLHDRLARLGAEAMLETLQLLARDELTPQPQNEADATYAKKLQKDEAWIYWHNDALQIHRQIRAFNPWPMSQSQYEDQIIRIHAAEPIASTISGQAGEVMAYDKTGLLIHCQPGQLRVTKCQLPGAKAMQIADLYNGHPNLFKIGTCFSPPPQSQ
jgi:methionyl-tRNA formyltransferase